MEYLPNIYQGKGREGKKLESWWHVKLSRCKEKTLQSMQRPVLLCHVGRGGGAGLPLTTIVKI